MAEDPYFVGVAGAKINGDRCHLRLAASDNKSYLLRLTGAAVTAVVTALQPLIPLQRTAERDTLQVIRSQPLTTADGRRAILLETEIGPIAYELSSEGIAILLGQLADLQSAPG